MCPGGTKKGQVEHECNGLEQYSAMQDLDNQVQSLDVCITEQKAAA